MMTGKNENKDGMIIVSARLRLNSIAYPPPRQVHKGKIPPRPCFLSHPSIKLFQRHLFRQHK